MKMRKRIAALIAVVMIAALMPMSAFADSTNRVDKVVTVAKDASTEVERAPQLKIAMKDVLTSDQSFYLVLTDAEWGPIVDADGNDIATALQNVAGVSAVTPQVTTPATDAKLVKFTINGAEFEAYREDGKTMAIKRLTGVNNWEDDVIFPLFAKVTGDEAFVKVAKYDTEVSNSEHLFAVSDAARVKVTVGDAPNFYRSGKIAEITLEERYAGAMGKLDEELRWFTIELRDTDFTFGDVVGATLEGKRGYRGQTITLADADIKLSADKTKLGIKLDRTFLNDNVSERGTLVLKGVEIIASRDARDGDVVAVIDSKKLFDKETVVLAKRGDYKTKLDVPKDWKYEVVAGNEKEVKFILSEELANSLVGTRPVTFTFNQGVKIKGSGVGSTDEWKKVTSDDILWADLSNTDATTLKGLITDIKVLEGELVGLTGAARTAKIAEIADKEYDLYRFYNKYDNSSDYSFRDGIKIEGSDVDDIDKDEWDSDELRRVHVSKDRDSFTVDNFNLKKDKAGKYTFTTTLLIPADVTGDITVEATGKGITEETIKILEVEAPVTVETTKMDIKVGLKEIETTGKIVIKETEKERLAQNKNIVLRIDDIDYGLKIKSYKAKVVEGDLVLADRKDTDLSIGVKRVSTEPSTIEITDIVMSTDRTVPEGKYDLVVGGNAISNITGRREFAKEDHFDIDPVAIVKDFINITTKNTEDIAGSANKAKVAFVVGSTEYLVNDKVEQMDVAPYIKDTRTMIPIRYVAAALGVKGDQVVWDQENKTATILADKTIQVKIGSKMMIVDGVSVPMDAAAEIQDIRTCIPVAEIARALNVPVEWDAATKTATFN